MTTDNVTPLHPPPPLLEQIEDVTSCELAEGIDALTALVMVAQQPPAGLSLELFTPLLAVVDFRLQAAKEKIVVLCRAK